MIATAPTTAPRQHPATSPAILAPYVPFGIEVEWYDQKGLGTQRAELEMVSRQRPYVVGHKHSRDTFTNLLPVLRPLASIYLLGPLGNNLGVQVAKLLLGEQSQPLTYRYEPQTDGLVVHASTQAPDGEPARYCTVLLSEENFLIQGRRGEDWATRNVLEAYDLLRRHHVAVGLRADQYVPY